MCVPSSSCFSLPSKKAPRPQLTPSRRTAWDGWKGITQQRTRKAEPASLPRGERGCKSQPRAMQWAWTTLSPGWLQWANAPTVIEQTWQLTQALGSCAWAVQLPQFRFVSKWWEDECKESHFQWVTSRLFGCFFLNHAVWIPLHSCSHTLISSLLSSALKSPEFA